MTYDEDLGEIEDRAIVEAAARFRRGLVTDQKLDFAPSSAQFCVEARRINAMLPYLDRAAKPAPRIPPMRSGGPSPFEISVDKARTDALAQGREIIEENALLDEFKAKARSGILPVGSMWRLGVIYGPATIPDKQGRLDMPKFGQEGGQDER